jgi:hypothetical protein
VAGSAAPTIFAAAGADEDVEPGVDDELQAAARTESGIKAAAVYAKRIFFAT